MLLKGCLHTHTTCSDGTMTPQEVATAYEERGYDFIAFTDHDYLLNSKNSKLYAGVRTDLIIFHGIEMTVFRKGYLHISRIRGNRETLHVLNHIGDYHLNLEQIWDRLAFLEEKFPIDAIEITSKGFRQEEFETEELPYPKIASDDSHTGQGIGRAWIELDTPRDKDSILKAIKRGEFWNCYV